MSDATNRELDQFYGHEVEERKVHEATKRHEDAFDLDDLFDACTEHEAVILHCIQKQQYASIGELFVKQRADVVKRRVDIELGLAGNAFGDVARQVSGLGAHIRALKGVAA